MTKNRYINALISATFSITPIVLIVLVLSWVNLSPLNYNRGDYLLLAIGAIVLIVGMAIFQIGAGASLTKVGEYMGASLSKQKNLLIVVLFALVLGTLITTAEPSIMIVSKQVNINSGLLIGGIAIGVGIFLVIGILRIIFQKSLKIWYLFFYFVTFMLLFIVQLDESKKMFLPFIFDSGGVTTGSATVPFILSLGFGIAMVRGGKNAKNESFGLVGLASIGPIITVALLLIILPTSGDFVPTYYDITAHGNLNILEMFAHALFPTSGGLGTMIQVAIALAPTLLIFLIYNFIYIKLPKKKISQLLFGFLLTYVGLMVFLASTDAVMTPLGNYVGKCLGLKDNWVIIFIAFIIGLVTILCEPAVHVLTGQMETISDGHIKKITVLLTLSIGVGIAIGLAAIRTVYNFSIMYYMIPGYLLSIGLMFICPDIYTAMAFDSGGTASGPMSSSFVLPLLVGVTASLGIKSETDPNYYDQSFGIVALIALTPVIAIQILGVVERFKTIRAHRIMRQFIYTEEDAQIIHF